MTEKDLIEKYGYWGEHLDYPAHEWVCEVVTRKTRLGYWKWVALSLVIDGDEYEC